MKHVTAFDNQRTAARDKPLPTRSLPKSRATGPRTPQASREAKRIAACVLEVLAGASSPTAAAAALEVSLPRYYVLEQRAIEALVSACEPRTGRTIAPHREIDLMRQQLARAERDATRYQTLLRMAQRTIGLASAATPSHAKGKGSKAQRTRRPTARALVAARALRSEPANDAPAADPTPPTHEGNTREPQPEGQAPSTL
jgi:hypothetical protein